MKLYFFDEILQKEVVNLNISMENMIHMQVIKSRQELNKPFAEFLHILSKFQEAEFATIIEFVTCVRVRDCRFLIKMPQG